MDIQTDEGLAYLYNVGKSGKGYNPEITPMPKKEAKNSDVSVGKKKKFLLF